MAVLLAAGCAAPSKEGPDPNRTLAPYSGRPADIFDDTIEPAAVGLDFEKGYAPRLDKTLRERTRLGDAVLRVRVTTVTAHSDGPDTTYQLSLHTVEKLAGKTPPPIDFTVHITRASESHGIMKSFEGRLVGYAFVAFVREFAHPSGSNGEREVHFHMAPDSKDVRGAVDDAMLFDELK